MAVTRPPFLGVFSIASEQVCNYVIIIYSETSAKETIIIIFAKAP